MIHLEKKIELSDYTKTITDALKSGVLLTTSANGRVNSMAISWGMIGIEWARPIFVVFVRENRFTKQLLDENGEFTINIPIGDFDKRIIGFCGTKSGKDCDKHKELGLVTEAPEMITVPGIRQLPLTLECRVVYRQKQDMSALSDEFVKTYYPQDIGGDFHGSNRDIHTAYYGEIVSAYIIE